MDGQFILAYHGPRTVLSVSKAKEITMKLIKMIPFRRFRREPVGHHHGADEGKRCNKRVLEHLQPAHLVIAR